MRVWYYVTMAVQKKITKASPVKAAAKSVPKKVSARAPERTAPSTRVVLERAPVYRAPLGTYPPAAAVQSVVYSPPPERPQTLRDSMNKETQVLPPKPKQRATHVNLVKYVIFTIVGAVVVGIAIWYLFADRLTAEQKKEAYVQSIATKVSKLALTPPGETPTIGVIPDPTSITDNKEFFKNASQGDYLVVYPNARLMLIYSPARNIVINMGYAEVTPSTEPAKEAAKSKKP
jgi:hypothetical protein